MKKAALGKGVLPPILLSDLSQAQLLFALQRKTYTAQQGKGQLEKAEFIDLPALDIV